MTYISFMRDVLAPAANASLKSFYERYCAGEDIGVEMKSDDSPASLADRETEKIVRDFIMKQYPDHGIWGEEFGAYHTDRAYVWILDPLDGTKQFIDKRPGFFGCLIGLLNQGKAVAGLISDPILSGLYCSDNDFDMSVQSEQNDQMITACTHPIAMLNPEFLERLSGENIIKKDMNCMAFVALLKGEADVFVEHGLGLHDIAALIPVMVRAGMVVVDFDGNDYRDYVFDLTRAHTQKFGLIASRSNDVVHDILALKPQGLKS